MKVKPLTPAKFKKALKEGFELGKEIEKEIIKMKLTPEERFILNESGLDEEEVCTPLTLAAISLGSYLDGKNSKDLLNFTIAIRRSDKEIIVYLPKINKKIKDLVPEEWGGCKVILRQAGKPIPA